MVLKTIGSNCTYLGAKESNSSKKRIQGLAA